MLFLLTIQWLYLALTPEWNGEEDKLLEIADRYFKSQSESPDYA